MDNPAADPAPPSQGGQANIPRFDNMGRLRRILLNKLVVAGLLVFVLVLVGPITMTYTNTMYEVVVVCIGFCYLVIFYPNNLLRSFAKDNHYSYLKQGFVDNQTGLIFDIGYAPEFDDIVYGMYRNWVFFLFLYSYSIGYEENSKRYSRTVLSIDFLSPLPSFVLRKHHLLQILEEEGESLRANDYTEKIHLEGDFDDYFQVFIKAETQLDVLTILTPDVMEIVMTLDKYEIEMTSDGKLYIYCHGFMHHKHDLLNTYTIIEALVPKIAAYIGRQQDIHAHEIQAGSQITLETDPGEPR